jgi:hypothetical protein
MGTENRFVLKRTGYAWCALSQRRRPRSSRGAFSRRQFWRTSCSTSTSERRSCQPDPVDLESADVRTNSLDFGIRGPKVAPVASSLNAPAMPSIEILCVGLTTLVSPPETSFAVICDPSRQSHREPSPRFQSDFDRFEGVLYHVGNPELASDPDGAFFAYDVLSEASRDAKPPVLSGVFAVSRHQRAAAP